MIRSLFKMLQPSWSFYRDHGLMHSLRDRNSPLAIQFLKYGICGLIATAIHISVVYGLGTTLNPAIGEEIQKSIKESRTMWNNGFAFLISNPVTYILNASFVFTPGRHPKHKELFLFISISALSFFAGLITIPVIFDSIDSNRGIEHLANLGFVLTSAIVNFTCRKFFVFKR